VPAGGTDLTTGPRPGVQAARAAARHGGRLVRGLPDQWRRSLQLRVVTTTVALGLVVISLLGAYLAEEISARLFESRRDQALVEARRGMDQAQKILDGTDTGADSDLRLIADDLRSRLEGVGAQRERDVLLLRPPGNDSAAAIGNVFSGGILPSAIPETLRRQVRATSAQQSQSIGIRDASGRVAPALAVGERVEIPLAGEYELYFVFDLSVEQATLNAVQRVLAIGGAALVLLLGGVAWVVTRQVVSPVRQAAAVAERLASGHLDERMRARGEDDLARLARSFNEMATSLGEQIQRMEELGRVQRRFVSDVSHELRTPLTTIRMAGEVLYESRHGFDPALARSAELLTAQIDRFEALLADLLEISRFDAGAAALEAEPIDVRSVVDRVVDLAQPLADRRGSELRVHMPRTPCMAEVDPRRLERILRNLVLNAVEHGEGKPVDVTLAADADTLAVVVRDHGVGLRPEEAARVFDRFWRADPARARSTGGSGLGLAIALEDAHLHRGQLEAVGRPGLGAAFRLTLPRRAGGTVTDSPLPLTVTAPAVTAPLPAAALPAPPPVRRG
jgi:two-component system sensor histidine kinase MtrB